METAVTFTCVKCGETASRVGQLKPTVCDDCKTANKRKLEAKRYNPRPKLIEPAPGIRRCQTCEQDKPYSEFATTRSILRRHCKVCFLASRAASRAVNGREAEYALQSIMRRVDPAVVAARELAQLKSRRHKAAYTKIDRHFAAKRRAKEAAELASARPYLAVTGTQSEKFAAKSAWLRENDKPAWAWGLFRSRVKKSLRICGTTLVKLGVKLTDVIPCSREEYSSALIDIAVQAFPERDVFALETGFVKTISQFDGSIRDKLEALVALDNARVESNLIEDKPWAVKGMRPHNRDKLRASMDPEFAIELRLRKRMRARSKGKAGVINKDVRDGVKGRAVNRATFRFVGYTPAELRVHLESLFTPEMSWEAFLDARIHLDHVRPLASYDLTDDAQLKAAWAMSNLQPLWALDNMKKGAKWDAPANDNEPLSLAA